MLTNLDHSIASHAAPSDGQVEQYCRYFLAPASDNLGRRVAVAIVAEGVDEASRSEATGIVVRTVQRYFERRPTSNPPDSILHALEQANAALLREKENSGDKAQMGVTATLAVIAEDRLYVGSVGQSGAFILHEGEIRRVSTDRNWVTEARRSWHASSSDLQEPPPVAQAHHLGENETVEPGLAPAEFLWPDDSIILLSPSLAGRLSPDHIRNIVNARPLADATSTLVDSGILEEQDSNLTALLIHVPNVQRAVAPLPTSPNRGFRPSLKSLLILDVLLLCLFLAIIFGNGGLGAFLAPQPTAELAMPAFVPSPMLDVGITPTPGDNALAGTPTLAPAAAPSVTPSATFTPQPLPPGWKTRPAPVPIAPANGTFFSGPGAIVILSWNSIGTLPQDMYYVVSIRKFVDGKFFGESRNWTKSTRIRLDSSFYAMQGTGKISGLAAPMTQGTNAQFQWTITVYQLTTTQPDGTMDGTPVSPSSASEIFFWGPPQQAPTRVYGG